MGLIVLAVMFIYMLFSLSVVAWAIGYARKNGKGVKRWGWGAALVVYMIPFWDLLPTLVADNYYCATESGFFVNKTLDQWKKQNPGVIGTLSMAHLPVQYRIDNDPLFRNHRRYLLPDGTLLTARFDVRDRLMYVEYKKNDGESGEQLNERLRRAHKHEDPGLLKLSRDEYDLIDTKTNEVLAREVDFQKTTKGKIWAGGDSWWKFWFQSYERCDLDNFPNGGMQGYIDSFESDCFNKSGDEIQRGDITISCPYRH